MSTVTYEKGGRITLNRPEVLNAIDDKLPHDLAACVEEANTGLCKKKEADASRLMFAFVYL